MRQERTNIFFGVDWVLVLIYFVLVGFGWMNIYAASFTEENSAIFDLSTKYGKQLLWIVLSIPLIILILFINGKFYERFASIFYLVSILSLLGLFVLGTEINGAKSWYRFGSVGLQPSEFAKAFTAMALAKLLSDRKYNLNLIKNQIKAFIIIFLPALLIAIHDAGSAIVYLSFFFVLNREGLTLAYIILGTSAIALFILTILFGVKYLIIFLFALISIYLFYQVYRDKRFLRFNWVKIFATYVISAIFILGVDYSYNNVLNQYQRDRFEVLLGLNNDTRDVGYNLNQAIETISSGGGFGKGFLKGDRTQGKFVPEQHTDYIFSTVGEEWGFIGTSFVVILFMLLLFRIISRAEQHNNKFGRIYGYGVASILFFHFIINIGMVIGLLPTVGIPLPFISYGGSSLWGFTLLLFVFVKLDAHKSYDW
ncbi:rod shape-determining protein RodA [Pseudotenacibaculum haliotis]|uniref:Cell wall polymerase n=1 Tax=Pseudotenacibaculum haliotis TaxID=1862138 RepID=A0ABW5LP23_9FLAO